MPTIHRVSCRLCCAFFLLWLVVQVSKASSFKAGKAKVTTVSPGLFACQQVSFATPFHGGHEVTVLASLGRSIKSPTRGNGGAIWVESVDQSGFKACILEYSDGSNNTAEVNWIATQSAPSGGKRGSISLGDWTTGTQCKKITFQQPFLSPPVILVTPSHKTPERPQDAMAVWMEDSREDSFKICLKESKIFDGVHKDIEVNWMAYTEANFGNFTLTDSLVFMKNSQRDNYAFCQRVNFTSPLFAPPVVALTPKRSYGNGGSLHEGSVCDAMTAWVEYTSRNDMEICTKNYHSDESMMSILAIDYLVIGDLDPCINVTCGYYRYCKALAPHVVRCVCADICPSYKEPVCSSNGTTYDNKCLFEQETCSLQLNFTIQHPGSCEGFPLQRGHRSMPHTPSLGYSFCQVISLEPFVFYPDKPIEVQITVNHQDTSDKSYVHDASVSWVENVNNDTFTACVMTAGFNERMSYSNVTVDWLAYQGAPAGGVAGVQRISQWWTGTTCETVKFPSGKFSQKPLVFVTVAHHHAGLKRDAASVWLEDITASSCKICLRELQNYAGSHEDIFVNWLAYSTSQKPFFSEQNSVYFGNSSSPPADFNNAFCKDIHFNKVYRNVPNVFVSANHSSTGGNLDPLHNSITAWVEYINTTGARVCLKEFYESKYDPLSIQYMVLSDICKPGWSYFGGYCYITSQACTTWLTAVSNCSTMSSSLVTVHNQNENVYIQHRHNGEKSWIGLNDRSVEGLFVWSDGESSRFRFWARNQPNNWKNEDCVHTLGSRHGYTWNDVPCDKCHKFTCYTDLNECSSNSDDCDVNAICHNTVGSYTCTCKPGYIGDGRTCHIRAAASWSFTTNGKGRYGSIQTFTVPKTTRYRIRAWGARGGTHSTNYGSYPGTYYGGKGAYKEGTFTLNKGTVLNIVVGQRGGDSVEVKGGRSTTLTAAQLGLSVEDNAGTGGGGGSFVYTTRNVLLLAAGGGGGASSGDNGVDGQSGTSGTSSVGKSSSQARRGGSGGSPGQCNSAGASYHGGVGAGWSGQGCSRAGSEHGERGGSRAQGWVGGRAGMMNSGNNGGPPPGAVGGFGGGGGGSEDNGASGGGGGYSGGGSGTHSNQAGGGGGSYCSGSSCSGVTGDNEDDDGQVHIVEVPVIKGAD